MVNTLDHVLKRFRVGIPKKGNVIRIPNFGRNDLAKVFSELKFNIGVEIGTEKGKYASVLCRENKHLKLFCVDPWKFYNNGVGYRKDVDQKIHDRHFETAKKRLEGCSVYFIRRLSMDSLRFFKDSSLDFVYIDGNHRLDFVTNDIVHWAEKVKPGGIVAGHDYIKHASQCYSHAPYALGAYAQAYFLKNYFVLDQKHKGRTKETNRYLDRIRSWFFVKE